MTTHLEPAPHPAVVHRVCTSKKPYGTYTHAVVVALKRSHQTRPLRIYRCPFGNHFHLTSKPDSIRYQETA